MWRTSKPEDIRTEQIIIHSSLPCPRETHSTHIPQSNDVNSQSNDVISSRRLKREVNEVRGETTKLWPFSKVTVGVLVLNDAHSGQLSDTLEIETPEGGRFVFKHLYLY